MDVWTETKSYLSLISNKLKTLPDSVRIAGFDLDDTLIHMPRGITKYTSWKFIDKSVKSKIKSLVENNYLIIIFTNQAGMSINKNFDIKKWTEVIDTIRNTLFSKKYYFAVYVAKSYDLYRKPNLGLWKQMKLDISKQFDVDKIRISRKSFFVGDAGGRTEPSPMTKILHPNATADHSDTDRKFALNIGIKFLTPEEFYTGTEINAKFVLSGFDPVKFLHKISNPKHKTHSNFKFKPRSTELIILIGPPGSGKTDFVTKYILKYGYVHINLDTCKTKQKCLHLTREALLTHQSVVIDNTNPSIESRQEYIAEAIAHSYTHIRCIVLDTSIILAKHLNNVRHVYLNGSIPKVTNIAYNIYKKKYIEPSKSESFDIIEHIDFTFDLTKLDDPVWKRIFMMWSEA